MRETVWLHLDDDLPALGSGWRRVDVLSCGYKWVRLNTTSHPRPWATKIRRKKWDKILASQPRKTRIPTGDTIYDDTRHTSNRSTDTDDRTDATPDHRNPEARQPSGSRGEKAGQRADSFLEAYQPKNPVTTKLRRKKTIEEMTAIMKGF